MSIFIEMSFIRIIRALVATLFLPAAGVLLTCVPAAQLWSQAEAGRPVRTVAHRGASKVAPENTLAAFLKAAEMGVDYVEMDVRQTKDGHFVLMHDASVRRTTDGKGRVADLTLEEIKKLDAGSWFSSEFAGESVPTLREVLRAIKGKVLPDIDFKAGDVAALVRLLEEEGYLADSNVTFLSGSWDVLRQVKKLSGRLLLRPTSRTAETGLEVLLHEIDPQIVSVGWGAFSEFYVHEIHRRGKQVFINALWMGGRKKFMQRALKAGCDFIIADKLDVLLPLVRDFNQSGTRSGK
ncbi:MAG: hypothetical protein KatS3mg031_0716 [Chitinophagales bacterium]|nr:MAG: hypothetical protein KatS3mg031_0716 [Chitinophagales bacterium]